MLPRHFSSFWFSYSDKLNSLSAQRLCAVLNVVATHRDIKTELPPLNKTWWAHLIISMNIQCHSILSSINFRTYWMTIEKQKMQIHFGPKMSILRYRHWDSRLEISWSVWYLSLVYGIPISCDLLWIRTPGAYSSARNEWNAYNTKLFVPSFEYPSEGQCFHAYKTNNTGNSRAEISTIVCICLIPYQKINKFGHLIIHFV